MFVFHYTVKIICFRYRKHRIRLNDESYFSKKLNSYLFLIPFVIENLDKNIKISDTFIKDKNMKDLTHEIYVCRCRG